MESTVDMESITTSKVLSFRLLLLPRLPPPLQKVPQLRPPLPLLRLSPLSQLVISKNLWILSLVGGWAASPVVADGEVAGRRRAASLGSSVRVALKPPLLPPLPLPMLVLNSNNLLLGGSVDSMLWIKHIP
jgi:hypothetical protein